MNVYFLGLRTCIKLRAQKPRHKSKNTCLTCNEVLVSSVHFYVFNNLLFVLLLQANICKSKSCEQCFQIFLAQLNTTFLPKCLFFLDVNPLSSVHMIFHFCILVQVMTYIYVECLSIIFLVAVGERRNP